MSTISVIDYIPGEQYFVKALQSNLTFLLGQKQIKKGRLLLFKRAHYHIVFTMLNGRDNKENFEIPIPFDLNSDSPSLLVDAPALPIVIPIGYKGRVYKLNPDALSKVLFCLHFPSATAQYR
jgi:hypothetical protein